MCLVVSQLQAEGAIGGAADDDSRSNSPLKQPNVAQMQKSADTPSKGRALEGRIAQLEGELSDVKMTLEAKDLMMREKDRLLAKVNVFFCLLASMSLP
jgi:hypothetical protein